MAFVVTAVATAIEVGTLATIATAVSEVGLALSVVGAVTGSKDLIKIGGVLGIAGGVGGLAASFVGGAADAAAGAAADTVGSSAADYVNGADLASDAATSSTGGIIGGAASAPEAGLVSGSAAPGAVSDAGSFESGFQGSGALQPQMDMAGATTGPTTASLSPSATPATASGSPLSGGAQAPVTPADYDVGGRFGPDNIDVGGGSGPTAAASRTGNSIFDSFAGWVKNNPKLAELGMQAVGGALKGMSDYSLAQQKLAQQQQLINQQSYGNQIGMYSPTAPANPTPGIIGGARG